MNVVSTHPLTRSSDAFAYQAATPHLKQKTERTANEAQAVSEKIRTNKSQCRKKQTGLSNQEMAADFWLP